MVTIDPQGPGAWSIRRGMQGHDVVALQMALRTAGYVMPVDGVFGNSTHFAVENYQAEKGLVADGIAGPRTQEKIVRAQSLRFGKRLPKDMLPSLAANESTFRLGCRSPHVAPDPGYDLGAFQHSLGLHTPLTQENIRKALSVPYMAQRTADEVLIAFTHYRRWGRVSQRRCWELAVLRHNWPVAADRLAQGLSIFVNPARDHEVAGWVVTASGGRLRTAREWTDSYIAKATALVRW